MAARFRLTDELASACERTTGAAIAATATARRLQRIPEPFTIKAWKARPLTADDRQTETDWLSEHWTYGGRIHQEAAAALITTLKAPSSRAVGHAIYLRLFAEFANALEVAGAWGWALRQRRKQGVLDALLTYPPNAPRDFYLAARRNRSGSPRLLLKLPTENRIVSALEPTFGTTDECRASLAECVGMAKFLADRYFDTNEVIRSTYNRAKHGATMLHRPSLDPREFYVVAPHLDVSGPDDPVRYQLRKFAVRSETIRSVERGVEIASTMIRYLAGLAKALDDRDWLYPRQSK